MTTIQHVGVLGLGRMGLPMARRLMESGATVVVWNRTRTKADPLIAEGASVAVSPAALARDVDVILVCVSDGPDVEQVLFGAEGAECGARAGALVIDCSTTSPVVAQRVASRLRQKQISFVDAPVSGGVEGAEQGTLTIMVGGTDADVERARPVLQRIGSTITHMGPVGSGQAAKLVNQIVVVGNTLAMCEALLFAQACGLDLERTLEAIEGGAAGSWMLSKRGPQILRGDFRPGFTIDLQQKDLQLALEVATKLHVPLPGTQRIHELYATLQQHGLGGEGNHALIKALEQLAGTRPPR